MGAGPPRRNRRMQIPWVAHTAIRQAIGRSGVAVIGMSDDIAAQSVPAPARRREPALPDVGGPPEHRSRVVLSDNASLEMVRLDLHGGVGRMIRPTRANLRKNIARP